MQGNNLQTKAIHAIKWSTITHVIEKLVFPVSNMVLARILTPEAFGVIAVVTMIISFTDMFTDAGFQKYLVQKEFASKDELFKNANVAFWTNLSISVLLWTIIIVFRDKLASIVGNPGLGNVIAIACVQLIFTSISSIQAALFRRNFDFKSLFTVRMIAITTPFTITIPLAFLGFGYWALIIGAIALHLSNAVFLSVKSEWKPTFFYKINILKEMISFSIWSLIEQISIWLTGWVDIFIIGSILSSYYLGLYRTSIMIVNGLLAVFVSSVIPVLFTTLSRLQNDESKFKKIYYKVQKLIAIIIFPLGLGIFIFRDFATKVFLGNQWIEAANIIGIWAIVNSFVITYSWLNSEVYRAKGKPKLSFLTQILQLCLVIPALIISVRFGFWALVYTRAFVKIQQILVSLLVMKICFQFSIVLMLKNTYYVILISLFMGLIGFMLKIFNNSVIWNIVSIMVCTIFYFIMIYINKSLRLEIFSMISKFLPTKHKDLLLKYLRIKSVRFE